MIKGSVIYMKKMRNGKRGFTLLEIITVVAIIVIIAGAAVVGVTVTLQRASATKAYLEANNGRNFESEARNTVKNLTVNAVDWSPIPKYTPQNLAKKKWDELLAFGWTEEELGGELKYRDNGWYIEALEGDPSDAWDPAKHNGLTLDQYTEMKNTVNSYLMAGYTMDEIGLTYGGPEGFSINPQWNPGLHNGKPVPGTVITPDPTQAPEPTESTSKETEGTTVAPENQNQQQNQQQNQHQTSTPGTNAAGSSVKLINDNSNYWGSRLNFSDGKVKKVVVVTDGSSFRVDYQGQYGDSSGNATYLGDGRWEIAIGEGGWQTGTDSLPFHVDNASYVYVESYELK
jgi:prepilin-type N-terminal cleavage/methylation domain-containing protein